jgi:8-oxo-dGTP pyrophosphatase MutT (NUDIX family)
LKPGKVRPIAICIIRQGDRVFVAEGQDPAKGRRFYRPLGGRIEFGELGAHTVAREIEEEIGAEIANVRYLGTLENIFTYNGEQGHEIVLVYTGDFTDPQMYDKSEVAAHEHDGTPFKAVWKRLGEFGHDKDGPLYPDGLTEMLS